MHNNELEMNEVAGNEEVKNYIKALVKFAKKRKMLEGLNGEIRTCINTANHQDIHIYEGIFLLGKAVNKEIMVDEKVIYFIYKNTKFYQLKQIN
ncbi:MAG: hypothetical protein ACRCU3_00345 [Eubacteriaceae bacterium]